MDNGWAPPTPDSGAKAPGSRSGEELEWPADDPLGDEAAFPSTWQELAPPEMPHE